MNPCLDFRRALDERQFVPFFQPVVTLRGGNLRGFEILARWNHPTLGIIPPHEFIPEAEMCGWIGELTQMLLEKAFEYTAALPVRPVLAINVSPVQLQNLFLPSQIKAAARVAGYPLDESKLVIEITESAVVDNLENASLIAADFKAMGCKLALDDFGTGYSSLLHLQALPFDIIKVDQSFVSSMLSRRDSRKIVSAVVGLGQSLDLSVIAEGVETLEQAEMLHWLGCDMAQGWLYGHPITGDEIPSVISRHAERIRDPKFFPWISKPTGNRDLPAFQRFSQLQAVYDGSPVGLAYLDRNFRFLAINERLAELSGSPVADHIGRSVEEMIPVYYQELEPLLNQALAGVPVVAREVNRKNRTTGKDTTGLLYYQPARDEAGEVIGILVTIVDITDRKKTELALRESELKFRHVLECTPQMFWITDPQGNCLDLDESWMARTGMSREECLGQGWIGAIHPDDVGPAMQNVIECLAEGRAIDTELRIVNVDGSYGWMRTRGSPFIEKDGSIIRWYGLIEDIDERKRMELALRESEEKYRYIVECNPQIPWIMDAEGNTIEHSSKFEERVGKTADQVRQEGWMESLHPDDRGPTKEKLKLCLEKGITFDTEFQLIRADGTYGWMRTRGSPRFDEDGKIMYLYGAVEDIDERKRMELALRESEERLRFVIECTGQIPWVVDQDGQNIEVGARWEELTGQSCDDVLSQGWLSALHPDDAVEASETFLARLETGESIDIEVRSRLCDGSYRWMRVRGSARMDEAGKVERWYGTLEDIEERKQMELALRESEEKFRFSVECNPQIPWIMDTDGNNVDSGSKWEERTGTTATQTRGRGWANSLHPDDYVSTWEKLETSLKTGEPIDIEFRVIRTDGTYGWMRTRGSPRRDVNGKILCWYGSVEDIDDRKREELAIRRRFSKRQFILNAIPTGVVFFDVVTGEITIANSESARVLCNQVPTGIKPVEWLEQNAKASPRSVYCVVSALVSCFQTKTVLVRQRLMVSEFDGVQHYVNMSVKPVFDDRGEFLGSMAILTEIESPTTMIQ